jgi:hypothetical protein
VSGAAGLRPFRDERGRFTAWPARRKLQLAALELLAERFEPGRHYHEREVNALLEEWHTFADPAMLRRGLCDFGHLGRTPDGSRYWRRDRPAPGADGEG